MHVRSVVWLIARHVGGSRKAVGFQRVGTGYDDDLHTRLAERTVTFPVPSRLRIVFRAGRRARM